MVCCVLVAVCCSVSVCCSVTVCCAVCCGSVVVVGARGGAGVVVGSSLLPRVVVGVVATVGAAADAQQLEALRSTMLFPWLLQLLRQQPGGTLLKKSRKAGLGSQLLRHRRLDVEDRRRL